MFDDERRMKIFADAETINGAVVSRSILPFHEAAQHPPILLETALQRCADHAPPAHGPPPPHDGSLYPLTLYISRVAGSKNIILSNFKPGHNSVTRTDVESSLYIVQQLDPRDPLFPPDPLPEPPRTASSDPESASSRLSLVSPELLDRVAIKRESVAPPPISDHPIFRHSQEFDSMTRPYSQVSYSSPASYPSQASQSSQPTQFPQSTQSPRPYLSASLRRKPVPADLEARRLSVLSALDHPLPPPPADDDPAADPDKPAVSSYLREVMQAGARRQALRAPPPPPSPSPSPVPPAQPRPMPQQRPRPASTIYPSSMYPTPRATPSPSPPHAGVRASIVSSININVAGTATLPSPLAMSLRVTRWHHGTGQTWPVAHLASAPLLPASSAKEKRKSLSTLPTPVPPVRIIMENAGYAPFADTPAYVFHQRARATGLPMLVRDVDMAYEKSWTRRLLQHKHKHIRGKKSEPALPTIRRGSSSGDEDGVNLTAGPGLKKEGYTFLTPWGTRCFFRTGKAGGSLVCYHAVPLHTHKRTVSTASAGYATSPEKDDKDKKRLREIPVSELRFNLPGKSLFGGASGVGGDERSFDDDAPNALGREKAGGGRHGDHAKMGKLIVFEGGRDMIDLVVAANMGIWWRTWEVAQ